MSRQRQTTSRRRARAAESLPFANKLVLNQWMISLFGIDPLREQRIGNQVVRPFHALVDPIKDPRLEGLDESNIHHFYHHLVNAPFFAGAKINAIQLLAHEENLVRHTQRINEKRYRPVVWKYYQWLTLLFTDIFLDKYFRNRAALLAELNEFIERVNARWEDYADILPYTEDDLNKLCYQNATGSGKTLIMHVNLLQHQHYARRAGREDDFSRVILLTPNERLSEQHLKEEGLPGNERKQVFTIPLNVTYDFGKKLKMLRPKQKAEDGREYDFKYDAPVPTLGEIPDYLQHNTVVSDWYPRIQAMRSTGNDDARTKQKGVLQEHHLALLDYDQLFFELEQFKRERSWYNLNIAKATYGGRPSKWVKKSSPRFPIGGYQYEYHWYEHPGIGRVELKRKQVHSR